MKKIFYIAVAASLSLVACQKNEIMEQPETEMPAFQIVATIDDSDTKTAYTDAGDVIKTTWVAGDKIGLYSHSQRPESDGDRNACMNALFKATEAGKTTIFKEVSGFAWYQHTYRYSFYSYYPYSESAGKDSLAIAFKVPASQYQKCANSMEHVSKTDLMYAKVSAKYDGDIPAPYGNQIFFSFKRALSVLEVNLKAASEIVKLSSVRVALDDETEFLSVSEGFLDPRDGSIDLKAGSSSIDLYLDEHVTLSDEISRFYIQVTPGHAGKKLSVYVTVNGVETKVGSVKVPSAGIPVGVLAQLPVFPVSNQNGNYEDLSANGTSNCYIISAPGNYKFKATVKGNGYIPSALGTIAGNAELNPKSALVLWYNTVQNSNNWQDFSPVVLSSASIEDGYICFSTPRSFISGNVLIAAFAEEGVTYDSIKADENYCITNATLLWSWNIWVAEGYDPEASTLTADGRKLMDRNLGAPVSGIGTTGVYEPAAALGNVYQWGRKDPFPNFPDYGNASYPCSNYSNSLFALPTWTPVKALGLSGQGKQSLNDQMFGYKHKDDGSLDLSNAENMPLKSDISVEAAQNEVYVGYATKNPHKIIKGTPVSGEGSYAWLNTKDKSWESLWGSEKTLYDPCPAGWRVWSSAEATVFLTSFVKDAQIASNLRGYMYKGYYFPLTGRGRDSQHGRVEFVSATGYKTESNFWCIDSCPHSSAWGHACRFLAPANYSETDYAPEYDVNSTVHPAAGYSVRCVKE